MNAPAEKKILRRKLRDALSRSEAKAMEQIQLRIQNALAELPVFQQARSVLFYAGVGFELQLNALMEQCLSSKIICLPKIKGQNLQAARVHELSTLQRGPFNIPEPPEACEPIAADELELILIPALAFDAKGYRLGNGYGYYDKFLPHCKKALKLGIAQQSQMLETLPTESHDIPMDCILTERKLHPCQKTPRH